MSGGLLVLEGTSQVTGAWPGPANDGRGQKRLQTATPAGTAVVPWLVEQGWNIGVTVGDLTNHISYINTHKSWIKTNRLWVWSWAWP